MGPGQIATIVFLVVLLSGAAILVYLGVKKDNREKLFYRNKEDNKFEEQKAAEERLLIAYSNLFINIFTEIKQSHEKTSSTRVKDINEKALEKLLLLESSEDFEIVRMMEKSKINFDFIEKLKINNASSWKSKFTKEFKKFPLLQIKL